MMMTITFVPMEETDFNSYLKISLGEYAYEHVKAGNWTEEEALQKAEEQFKELLPEGLETENHYFFSLYDHELGNVGILWLNITEDNHGKKGFIFDIKIDEQHQGSGLGKGAMYTLDEYCLKEGIKQMRLHVFAHNQRAVALYEKMGFMMTDYMMSKIYE
ncbi:GNAT family N-acetyltransferase [Halobacillus salinarum]|uniref:GNAT family N-acetyltransferase n=1 Tax=Halobacillus salinarum TaxID=2932257 RepID=A0ABY4EDU4_9BACI|nr:GNAT family N-acetyltransferase [Halobacillus salinarum]UOQ42623.1 GNAT family N-acetyltransferase [Halobacillus salinarum]